MAIIFSKKCELGLQAALFLSTLEPNEAANAKLISKKIKVPKEFVSKTLQSLVKHKIVKSRKGKGGGFRLGKHSSKIKLIDIVKAIDGTKLFENCVLGFPGCSDDTPCPIHNTWAKIREETYRMLSESSLEQLKPLTDTKIKTIKENK